MSVLSRDELPEQDRKPVKREKFDDAWARYCREHPRQMSEFEKMLDEQLTRGVLDE